MFDSGSVPRRAIFSSREDLTRDDSLIRNRPPPQDHRRALGIFLLKGLTGKRFLMSEVPLYLIGPFISVVLSENCPPQRHFTNRSVFAQYFRRELALLPFLLDFSLNCKP